LRRPDIKRRAPSAVFRQSGLVASPFAKRNSSGDFVDRAIDQVICKQFGSDKAMKTEDSIY
jgi:hypothetical protein